MKRIELRECPYYIDCEPLACWCCMYGFKDVSGEWLCGNMTVVDDNKVMMMKSNEYRLYCHVHKIVMSLIEIRLLDSAAEISDYACEVLRSVDAGNLVTILKELENKILPYP